MNRIFPTFLATCLLALAHPLGAATPDAGAEFFETTVRPLLVAKCFECHSAESKKLKGSLRLDGRDLMLKGGDSGPAIEPGKPDKSRIIEAIAYTNPDLQMPPKSQLTPKEVADLTRWVAMGAPWPASASVAVNPGGIEAFDLEKRRASHWAWQPIKAVTPPAASAKWGISPIDAFLLAKLKEKNLDPAAPADRRTLLRRVTFELTGLPPTPEEIEAFVADKAPDGLAKVVDRLLASPRYGERWARHWMDLTRYADTLGNESDATIANAWRYRDYLIRAFNADIPYNQLVTEHLAGDLLQQPRRHPTEGFNESIIATGFFWLNEGKRSPVDVKLAEAECFDNKIDVMCKTFLGMTADCARFHDHKFDAIGTDDYYGLYGYLRSSRYTQALLNKDQLDAKAGELQSLRQDIRKESGAQFAKRAATISKYLLAARASAARPADAVAAEKGLSPAILKKWITALKQSPVDHAMYPWVQLSSAKPEEAAARSAEILKQLKSREAESAAALHREADIELADFPATAFAGWFSEDQSFGKAPSRPGDYLMGPGPDHPVTTFFRDGTWAHSASLSRKLQGSLRSPTFTIDRKFLHVFAAGRGARINVNIEHYVMIQDPLFGGLRKLPESDGGQWITFDLSMWKGNRAYVEFADTTTLDLHDNKAAGYAADGYLAVSRVLLSDESPPGTTSAPSGLPLLRGAPVASLAELADRYQQLAIESLAAFQSAQLSDKPDANARASYLSWLVENGLLDADQSTADEAAHQKLDQLFKRFHEIESHLPEVQRAPATVDGTAEDENVFIRGGHKNLGKLAPRHMLAAIAGKTQPPPSTTGSGRLELAKQFTDPANPLISRVIVNRVWHHLFGRGIVASVDNFGVLGERPSHPELLDYLADRFVKEGWSIKKLIREMVLTSAYQMDSRSTLQAETIDPENQWLHRANVRRIEGEAIRDTLLAVSGRLDTTMYGKPVEVYLTSFMDNYIEAYGKPGKGGTLDGDGRRSVYMMIRRNFLSPMMAAFDTPPPLNTAGRRGTSNVPSQALILMNDPFVQQQAQRWAQAILSKPNIEPYERVRQMYLQAFARGPTNDELATVLSFVDSHGEELGIAVDARADDVRVWTDVANVLINVKEFVFLR